MNPSQEAQMPANEKLSQLIQTVHRLRAPGGCPWDQAQTHQSLRQYLIEESYEVLDILDLIHSSDDLKKDSIRNSFREELGDVLLQVLLHSEMAHEVKAFDIYEVAQTLNDKLIRRHPHVFGESHANSADSALQNWEKQKAKEKASQPNASVLDGVPKQLPALQKAARMIEKVTKVGFQWDDMTGPLDKINEELNEFKTEVLELDQLTRNAAGSAEEKAAREKVESELGDLLFTLCNVASLLKVSPEDALRGTLSRFQSRFRHVENRLKEKGKTPAESDLAEMDVFWNEAKKIEKTKIWGLTGGIGSGKSTIGKFFIDLGIPVIDADQISREVSSPGGTAFPQLISRFGTAERSKLREIVFRDTQARKDLESILHPLIQKESQKKIFELSQNHSVIVYEAALLIETGRYRDFSGLIVVEAPLEEKIQRIMQRDQISREHAERIIQSQISDEKRREAATFIISNTGTQDDLREHVRQLAKKSFPEVFTK